MAGAAAPVEHLAAAPMIGRAVELGRVLGLLERDGVVFVEGAAGLGKSRLVRACLADASARRPMVAACQPYRQPQTLAAIVDALRDAVDGADGIGAVRLSPVCAALRPLFPEWAAALPVPSGDGPVTAHQTMRGIAELLDALRVDLLVIEDAHWAEAATIDLLLFLASRPRPIPALITYRGDEDAPALQQVITHVTRDPRGAIVALNPLDVAQTGVLISELLGGASVSADFAEFVHLRTDGLPLAIEEATQLMIARQDIVRVGDGWMRRNLHEIDVPGSVREAVLQRLRDVDAPTRAVAETAAVLGELETTDVLAAVSGTAPAATRDAVDDLITRGLFVAGGRGRIGYRHALTAHAVLDEIPLPRRTALHARAAAELASRNPEPVTRLARHYRDAGLGVPAGRYAERAADLALAAGDLATAVAVLHQAFATLDLPARDSLRLVHRIPLWGIVDRCAIEDIIGRLRALLGGPVDPPEQGELRLALSRMLLAIGDAAAAAGELAAAVDDLAHRPDLEARALSMLASCRFPPRCESAHRDWRNRADALIPQLDPLLRFDVEVDVVTSGLEAGDDGMWPRARAIERVPASPQRRAVVMRANLNLGDIAMHWGDDDESRQRLRLAREQAAELEQLRIHYLAELSLAQLDWACGRWSGLVAALASLAAHPGGQPDPRTEPVLLATLHESVTRPDLAVLDRLAALVTASLPDGDYANACAAASAAGRLALRIAPERAALVTEAATAIAVEAGGWLFAAEVLPVRADVLVADGRIDAARDLAVRVGRVAARSGSPALHAADRTIAARLARVDDPPAAVRLFARAEQAWQEAGRSYLALLAAEQGALAAGPTGGAQLLACYARLVEIGALADADRVARTLRVAGVAPVQPWRGGRRGYGDTLSPREVDVLTLVARGHTNREVAAALFRSPKTVSTQLQSAMRKLGVSSRTAAAMAAAERGLLDADAEGLSAVADPRT